MIKSSGRLALHVGTHKTGSTSIQRTLDTNRKSLIDQSIWYPDYSSILKKSHYAHIGVANALADDHDRLTVKDAELFFTDVKTKSERYKLTIISAESMYRQTIGPTKPQLAACESDYWKMRLSYIKRVYDLIGPAEIIFVVRRQSDFAESMYQEHIKATRYSRSFRDFLKEFWFHFKYFEQIEAWASFFPKVDVIRFDDIKGPDITRNFLNQIGIKNIDLIEAPMQNIRLSHDALLFKRWLNDQGVSAVALKRLVPRLAEIDGLSLNKAEIRSFFDGWDHRREFQDEFSVDNVNLLKYCHEPERLLFEPLESPPIFGDVLELSAFDNFFPKVGSIKRWLDNE